MADELNSVFSISGSALRAQNQRLKAIAENIANAGTTPSAPGQQPYQRQVVVFKDVFDKTLNAHVIKVTGTVKDNTPFGKKFDPSNPAADKDGYIATPNVQPLVEMMDMREAQRAYEANLNVIEASRSMLLHTINLLSNN